MYLVTTVLRLSPNKQPRNHLTDRQMTKQTYSTGKSKELQPYPQSQRFATRLFLPQMQNDNPKSYKDRK